jgi:hypothetical protein
MDSEAKGLTICVFIAAAALVAIMVSMGSCDRANRAAHSAFMTECVKNHSPLECKAAP